MIDLQSFCTRIDEGQDVARQIDSSDWRGWTSMIVQCDLPVLCFHFADKLQAQMMRTRRVRASSEVDKHISWKIVRGFWPVGGMILITSDWSWIDRRYSSGLIPAEWRALCLIVYCEQEFAIKILGSDMLRRRTKSIHFLTRCLPASYGSSFVNRLPYQYRSTGNIEQSHG